MMQDYVRRLRSDGYCIVRDVLDARRVREVREALADAAEESERRGVPTFIPGLDHNSANVRVFNLIDLNPLFRELIMHPTALELVHGLLGEHYMISNFTANIARPGSRSMNVHSDQAIVIPEPWEQPWALNVIWCLDDVTAENGGTLYLPGSHQIQRLEELPPDIQSRMVPFTAPAGSIIGMEGRMWHTSGPNTTVDQERALLFGYYTMDFVRPQVNWNAQLSPSTIRSLPAELFERLGLGPTGNVRHGSTLTLIAD